MKGKGSTGIVLGMAGGVLSVPACCWLKMSSE